MKPNTDFLKLSNTPLWFAPEPPRPALDGSTKVDVVVVGAGYTGLWTAYYLSKSDPSLNIALVEQKHVGFGASGRNGGWASAIFPISLERVAQISSHEGAVQLQNAMNGTVDEIGRVTESEGIDADYAKNGFLSLARSPAQLKRGLEAVENSASFGFPNQWQYLDASQASTHIHAENVLGGIYTPHCAIIHPGKLVRGLARVVERQGVTIYEGTTASHVSPHVVETDKGNIQADVVVRATEAYSLQHREFRRAAIPLYTLVLATEPLTPAIRQKAGLHQRMAFNDMQHMRDYAQLTADGRLVFGGRGAPYRFGSHLRADDGLIDQLHVKIHENLIRFFPQLADVTITHRWGGAMAVARDWCPSVCFDDASRVGWAGHYVGDGVATSNLSGRILCDLILNRNSELTTLPLVNRQGARWEREPLRWVGINSGILSTSLSDVEERLTGRPSRLARILERMTGAH